MPLHHVILSGLYKGQKGRTMPPSMIELVNALTFVNHHIVELRRRLVDETDYGIAMGLDLAATQLEKTAKAINYRIEAIEIAKAARE